MNMCGEPFDKDRRRLFWMMDRRYPFLILIPKGWITLWISIKPPQMRPPFALQPLPKGDRIEDASDIAENTLAILRNENQFGMKLGIGRGIDVSDQPAVAVERRRILAGIAGQERDGVELINILGPNGSNGDHRLCRRRIQQIDDVAGIEA